MKRSARVLAVVLCVALVSGCATVTASTDGSLRSSPPTWSHRMWFLFGGFVSDKHVDVRQACSGRTPVQLQSQYTFVDGVINIVTFGILAPRTAKVWCS